MPKRVREKTPDEQKTRIKRDHTNGLSPALLSACRMRLEAYVKNWMSETSGEGQSAPSSIPSLLPLPTILDVMMGKPSSPSVMNSAAGHAAVSGVKLEIDGVPSAVEGTGVVYDDVMLKHESKDPGDYERPARLRRTVDHLRAVGLLPCCRRIPRHVARTKELRLVHSMDHINYVDQLELEALLREADASCSVGQDLYANSSTPKSARTAVGCVIAAALSVVRGEVLNSFALVRPPGHHASANAASGFCFFNNVAVAVRVAQKELQNRGTSSPRALVLDWDVHHCDGTESIFYEDPSVVVVSIHQYVEGRGHVLRKTPTVFASDLIDLSALAALMEEENGGSGGGGGEANNHGGANGDDVSASKNEEEKKIKQDGAMEEEDSFPEKGQEKMKRSRKPVDYAKLAADLEDDDDEAIAMMFGIRPEDLKDSSVSSSTSSNKSNSSGNSGSCSSSSNAVKHKKLPGDTEGLSADESENGDAPELFYPGTGHLNRVGGDVKEEARGKNINIPWPTVKMGDLEYLQVILDIVAPVIREFNPHIVFLSCGFDSAEGDLLGSMRVSPSGYYILTKALAALCPQLVVALEGGYHLSNVARCSESVMRALLEGSSTAPLPKSRMLWCQAEEIVNQVRETHKDYWRCFSHTE